MTAPFKNEPFTDYSIEENARAIRDAGGDHLVLRTDGDWLFDLVRFVALRRRRMEATVTRA